MYFFGLKFSHKIPLSTDHATEMHRAAQKKHPLQAQVLLDFWLFTN